MLYDNLKKIEIQKKVYLDLKSKGVSIFAVDTDEVYMTTELKGNKTSSYHLIKVIIEVREILLLKGRKRLHIYGKKYYQKIVYLI